jgi:hypothetical protein
MSASGVISVPPLVSVIIALVLVCFYGLSLIGLQHFWQKGYRWETLIMLSVPISLLIPTLIAFGGVRFALPSFPVLSILAATGFGQVKCSLKARLA